MSQSSRAASSYHGLRLLAVHAHPDDESSKGAATTARYAALGARVMIATLTGGEAGDILNPAMLQSPKASRDIAGLRREEMAAAAAELGAEHRWIGFVDSGLPEGDPAVETPHGCFYRTPTEVAARPLVHLLRTFRPHVVTTYDELGGYPHPDHIKTHEVTMSAVASAADAAVNPELGEPWSVQKVYYNQDLAPRKWQLIHDELLAAGKESPFQEMLDRYAERPIKRETWLSTAVRCQEHFPQRDRALLSHTTQIDPDGGFFSEGRREALAHWPTEEFELALDRTGRPALDRTRDFVEDDLFAGVTRDDGRRVPDDALTQDGASGQDGARSPDGARVPSGAADTGETAS